MHVKADTNYSEIIALESLHMVKTKQPI